MDNPVGYLVIFKDLGQGRIEHEYVELNRYADTGEKISRKGS